MPTNVFISFEHHDLERVNSIRALASNPWHDLEFHDRSELDPVTDKRGTPLPYQPDDPARAKPIKNALRRLLKQATKMVVIVGEFTRQSNWVEWEIQSFYDRQNSISGDGNRRIVALLVPEANGENLPRIIQSLSIPKIQWNMNALVQWMNTNPNQSLQTLPFFFE